MSDTGPSGRAGQSTAAIENEAQAELTALDTGATGGAALEGAGIAVDTRAPLWRRLLARPTGTGCVTGCASSTGRVGTIWGWAVSWAGSHRPRSTCGAAVGPCGRPAPTPDPASS